MISPEPFAFKSFPTNIMSKNPVYVSWITNNKKHDAEFAIKEQPIHFDLG